MDKFSTRSSIIEDLAYYLSKPFRKRYNIFAGTNSSSEWLQCFRQWYSHGPYNIQSIVNDYENQFADRCGVKHGISFGAGRMGLFAILEAMGIGPSDEVIIPAFTCVVVPNAILYRNAKPVYVDIEPKFFNINIEYLESKITPRTKALYAQHTFGVPCDVNALKEIAHRYRLPIIEDGAHALGASYQGKSVGSLSEVAFFSTDHSKVINTYLGGMVVTNDDVLAERLRKIQSNNLFLKDQLMSKLIRSFLVEYFFLAPSMFWVGGPLYRLLSRLNKFFSFQDELETSKPIEYPYPCRLSSAQAEIGLSQLQSLENNLSHRREIANWLEKKIGWTGLEENEINESTWLRYSFLVKNREHFEMAFRKRFDLGVWFTSVVAGRSHDFEKVKYQTGSCPIAEKVARHIVNFPTHQRIPLEVIQDEVNRNWGWMKSEIIKI